MKKVLKQTLVILLTVVMMFTTVAVGASAKNDDTYSQPGTETGVVNGKGMGTLLNSISENNNGTTACYITDVVMNGKKAAVTYQAENDCTIVVAIYDENSSQMLGSGIVKASADNESTEVTIDVSEMPDYFALKAFMLDDKMAPIGKCYTNMEYSKAQKEFLEKKPSDFDDVVYFDDENQRTNFAALNDTVKSEEQIGSMTWTYNEFTGTYTFSNPTTEIKNLKSGDTYFHQNTADETDILLFKVKSVSSSDGKIVIVEDKDIVIEDAFDFLRVEVVSDENSGFIDEEKLPEDVTISNKPLLKTQKKSADKFFTDDGENIETQGLGEDTKFSLSGSLDIKTKDVGEDGSVYDISGKVTASADYAVKAYYDPVLFGEDYYEVNLEQTYKLDIKLSISGGIGIDKNKVFIPITVQMGIFTLSGKIYPVLEAKLKVDLLDVSVTSKIVTYASNETDGPVTTTESDKKWNTKLNEGVKFEIKIGIGLEISVTAVGCLEIGVDGNAGVKIVATSNATGESGDVLHECTLCFDCDTYLVAEISVFMKLKFFSDNLALTWTPLKLSSEIRLSWASFYISISDDGFNVGFGECPRKNYSVRINIVGGDNANISGANAYCSTGKFDSDGDGKFNETSAKTGEDGVVKLYCRPGTHNVTLSAEGYEDKELKVNVLSNKKYIRINMATGEISYTEEPTNSGDGVLTGNEKVGDIIEFGSYPQSLVTDSATIAALDGISKNWVSYGYYSGTGNFGDGQMKPSDYMKYADISYGLDKYRAVIFSSYRPRYTGFELNNNSVYNEYQSSNGYQMGNVYYFKYETLSWVVLDPTEGFVICENVIDSQAYQNYIYYNNNNNGNGWDDYYNSTECTHYAADWPTCSLREWLNKEFYNTAFTSSQKSQIAITLNDNKSPIYQPYYSDDTFDRIFLLSYNDVKYSFGEQNSSFWAKKSTDYAQCQGCPSSKSSDFYLGNSSWWLRSAYDYLWAHFIDTQGITGTLHVPYYHEEVGSTIKGIVPALKLKTSGISTDSAKEYEITLYSAENTLVTVTTADSSVENLIITCSSCIAGNDYILLHVLNYGENFKLSTNNLLYIDQLTADESGKVSATFIPKYYDSTSTTLLIGDFGSGVESKELKATRTYTAKLMVDGKLYKEIEYNEGQKSISLPPVPEKAGYTGEWESYSLTNGGTIINAIYTAISTGKVKAVSLGNDLELNYKASAKLNPKIESDNGVKYNVEYKSSNNNIATVDNNGNVYGAKKWIKDTTTITCTVTDEYGNSVSDACNVTVGYSWWQWIIGILLLGFLWY